MVCSSCVLAQDCWFVPRGSDAIHHLTFVTRLPSHPQLSNQPVLICYNRGPSAPYYSNPCDVIPKHCFLSSERRTILYLTTDGGISSPFLLYFLLLLLLIFYFYCSFLWLSHQHRDKERGNTVISLLDHFINNKPTVSHAAHSSTNNAQSVCWASGVNLLYNCGCVRASVQINLCLWNSHRKCGVHSSHFLCAARGDVSRLCGLLQMK